MDESEAPQRSNAYDRHPLEMKRALPMALLRAREAVMGRFRPMLAEHGITEQQWRVMRLLAQDGDLDATAISQRASIFPSSLSRIIKTLEHQGTIGRTRHSGDGRRRQLHLTENGRRMISEITPESLAIYADLERAFGADRVAVLLDMLNDLAASADPSAGKACSQASSFRGSSC